MVKQIGWPLILLLIFSNRAQAESFKIAGRSVAFEDRAGLLTSGCSQQSDCEAMRAVRGHPRIDLKKARRGEKFRGSTGSDTCKLIYGAGSVLGLTANRDQRSFCVFKDGSMIENNSLGEYLLTNQIVSKED